MCVCVCVCVAPRLDNGGSDAGAEEHAEGKGAQGDLAFRVERRQSAGRLWTLGVLVEARCGFVC
jgi:hypothetical protein